MAIGRVAKNSVRKSEQLGKFIAGAEGVVEFLDEFFFDHIGEGREPGARRLLKLRGLRAAFGVCTSNTSKLHTGHSCS